VERLLLSFSLPLLGLARCCRCRKTSTKGSAASPLSHAFDCKCVWVSALGGYGLADYARLKTLSHREDRRPTQHAGAALRRYPG
jgi:hypothetical protein